MIAFYLGSSFGNSDVPMQLYLYISGFVLYVCFCCVEEFFQVLIDVYMIILYAWMFYMNHC
jgi:lipopolysaccharide export LptBFGC system permease protein LptF